MVRSASLASLALLLAAPPAAARAADELPKEQGVYWEQSVEMQMAGFSMPAQTTKVCLSKKGLEEPPRNAKDDGKCEMTDVKRTGSRMTWKMKCKDGSTGEGDITSGPDSFDGKMTMRTQGQEVFMKMKGKKLGGDCDANEGKRRVAGLQKQASESQARMEESQAKACEDAATEMSLMAFVPPYPGIPVTCKDPSKLCANLETREGLVALKKNGGTDGRAKAEKLCKKSLDGAIEKLCAATRKEQERSTKLGEGATMEFVFGYCPDLARALAKRECSGRKFTALPEAQRTFCTRWAQQGLEEGGEAPAREPARAPAKASGKYLDSGIPDAGLGDPGKADKADKTEKKDKKKRPAAEDEDDSGKPKDPADMKSRIMKGIFGR
jgi:hypothetical protein